MILLTGGSGLLGTELQRHIECYAPSKDKFDITDSSLQAPDKTSLIIHAAAYTNVNDAETHKDECYRINVTGTKNIVKLGIPIIYISTDSVFGGEIGNYKEGNIPYPSNFYSLTKLLGEGEVYGGNNVIIRTSFKPNPWKSEYAFTDQYSSAEYVDEIALKISKLIRLYPELPNIVHVGGKRISSYDLAIQTRPDVKPISIHDIPDVLRPHDTSLNCSLMEELLA